MQCHRDAELPQVRVALRTPGAFASRLHGRAARSATSVPMIATTTSSSTSVHAAQRQFTPSHGYSHLRVHARYATMHAQRAQPQFWMNHTLAAAVPRGQSACHALVGLLTPERPRSRPSHRIVRHWSLQRPVPAHGNGVNQNASRIVLGYSGGAVPDSHRVPCFVGSRKQAADHQRTS